MFRTEDMAADLERFPLQLHRLGVVAVVIQRIRQIAHRIQCVRMFRTEDAPPDVKALLLKVSCA